MSITYRKLWSHLAWVGMSKTELCELSGVNMVTLAKMKKGGEVRTDTLEKICSSLHLTFDQIMEIETPKEPGQSET